MLLWLLLPVAWAAGAPALSVPVAGGALVSPVQPGPTGLVLNPAAAGVRQAESYLDLGLVQSTVSTHLDGAEATSSTGTQPIPTLGLTAPLADELGIGLLFVVPYGRSGGSGDPKGPERFHSIQGSVQALELDLALAWTPVETISIGVAGRVARLGLESERALDTGAVIAAVAEADPEGLVGEPFLEGRTVAANGTGWAPGLAAGVQVVPAPGWTVAAWFRSPLSGTVEGDFTMVPSNDLLVRVEGGIRSEVNLPAEAGLALEAPVGPVQLTAEVAWIGWSSWRRFGSQPHDLRVVSEDPVLDDILETFEITLSDLLAGIEEVETRTGARDVWTGGLSGRVAISERVTGLVGLYHSPTSIPTRRVSPTNLDFATTDLRLGAFVDLGTSSRLALVGDAMFTPDRVVTNSVYDPTADPASGNAYPSANGRYSVSLSRLGLSWIQRL